jgi:hypothetical protein
MERVEEILRENYEIIEARQVREMGPVSSWTLSCVYASGHY